jgi:adenylate cyclase
LGYSDSTKGLRGRAEALLTKMPTKKVDLGIAIVVTVFAVVVYSYVFVGGNGRALFAFLGNIEQKTVDARFKMRGPRPHDDRIVIVAVDENTIQKTGAYPIPRNAFAKVVDKLSQGGAATVSFDYNFPTPEKNSAVEALQKLQTELVGSPAQVLEKIREVERRSDNDAQFADAMKRADNVILGHLFLGGEAAQAVKGQKAEEYANALWGHPWPQMLKAHSSSDFDLNRAWSHNDGTVAENVSANMQILSDAAKSSGFFDISPDSDGTVRRAMLLIRFQDKEWYPSLALETVRQYEHIKDQSMIGYLAPDGLERIEFGPHVYVPQRDGTIPINFAGPYRTYKQYSLADVVDGTIPAETFKDKIVFIGATAKAAGDLRSVPYQSDGYMGVELHANVVDNLLHYGEHGRGYLTRGPREEAIDLMFLLGFGIGMGYLFGRLRPVSSLLSMVAALTIFGCASYLAFSSFGMLLNIVMPMGTLILNFGSITSYRLVFEEREKRKVGKMFGRYVSPGVIRLLQDNPDKYLKAGGEMKDLTVMFSDIRSFTTISEGLTPNELVQLLNEYLGEMTDIMFKRWGTLDKYIGDAIMGFWGSPYPQDDHAIRACACALEMSARLQELNLMWEGQGKKTLAVGIGLNTGPVNVGNMGSQRRFAWTVMGDHVNLSSRLEGMTKEYHTERLVSEFTYAQAKDHFVFRELDRIRVKGKLKPVAIYELMGWKKDESKFADRLRMFDEAKQAYHRHEWDEAAQKFEALLAKYPKDGASEVLLQRCLEFRRNSPATDWDGVYVMTTK